MKMRRRTNPTVATIVVLMATAIAGTPRLSAGEPAAVEQLRINQLQFIGTHNSYHVRDPAKPNKNFPDWSYSHAPLDVQLERGVRSFELDLQYRNGEFQVFHVAKLDEGSTCRTLKEGLETIRRWADAHSRHLPISILFELKQEGPMLDPTVKTPDAAALDQLDRVLLSVFPRDRTITPDDVRGSAATLRDAVQKSGWPTLESARGKVFYILHDERKERDLYTHDHPSLKGRVMFVRSDESRDDAATLVMDDPRGREHSAPGEGRLFHPHAGRLGPADEGAATGRSAHGRPRQRSPDREHRLPARRSTGSDGIRRRVQANRRPRRSGSCRSGPGQSGEWAGDAARAGARPVNESPNVPRPSLRSDRPKSSPTTIILLPTFDRF